MIELWISKVEAINFLKGHFNQEYNFFNSIFLIPK
jgi:hypothetical protein